MVTAADVVSYVGIPLAVLGVLPIIYTCGNGIITLSNIRKALRRNGLDAVTRGSYLAGIVEVELPRWTITPLDRDEPEYWALDPNPSNLRGGSWTLFQWNKVITGRKLYRLEYSSDLQEPQAEVNLEELIAFLLDHGAVPDAKGMHLLRLAGLFTPVGTAILLSPDRKESVLRISVPDDSDGILSLALNWRAAFHVRDEDSLPPSWMRVQYYMNEAELKATDPEPLFDESGSLEESKSPEPKNPIRFHLGVRNGSLKIETAKWEKSGDSLKQELDIDHIQDPSLPQWAPAVAIALGQIKGLALWTCHIPDTIAALAQKDILPCGVLVMCGVLGEADAPAWETPNNDQANEGHRFHQKFITQQSRVAAERLLPPAQAQAARTLREAEERDGFFAEAGQRYKRDQERRVTRNIEALQSSRMDTLSVANVALKYLQRLHGFDGCNDVQEAAEKILYTMLESQEATIRTCDVLNRWQQWTDRGGLNREDLESCQNDVKSLCFAICMMGCLKLAGNKATSSLALDLQECVKVWKRVRLG